jgi:hypothetical protein
MKLLARFLAGSRHELFQEIWMAAFVNQAEEVNRLTCNVVVDVKWKRFCATTWKTMWTNVIATAPTNNLPRLG